MPLFRRTSIELLGPTLALLLFAPGCDILLRLDEVQTGVDPYDPIPAGKGPTSLSALKRCAHKNNADSLNAECISDTRSGTFADGKVVVGSLTDTVNGPDGPLSPQTDSDMVVAKVVQDDSIDWIVAFSAFTAYSALYPDDTATFGAGTTTDASFIAALPDAVIGVAGVFSIETYQRCFVAKFKSPSRPPAVRFLTTSDACDVTDFWVDEGGVHATVLDGDHSVVFDQL